MKTSETITKLAPALVKAQRAISPATKDKTNPLYKSKYADLSAVLHACMDALNSAGIALMQTPVHSEDGKVHMTTRLQHESGEWMEETFSIPAAKQDAHGYGSACTYLRRFSVSAWLGISTEEDDDGNAASTQKPPGMTARQVGVDEFAAMSPDEQRFIMDQAAEIEGLHREGKNLYDYVGPKHFTQEELLALGSCLSSEIRSKLKRDQEAHRASRKANAAELASQA